jgi:hydroxymethylpyrimidine pyrophosphatase-like HAD family hydrolase
MVRLIFCICLLSLSGCQSAVDNAYYGMWQKLGVEKRDILVDRVEDAQDSQKDAQEQFASALDEFSALINFDGGELEDVYTNLSDQLAVSKKSAASVSERIEKVEGVANALFVEWKNEIDMISSTNLKRDSQRKLAETKRKYSSLLVSMRKVEKSMTPVLIALQDNVLALKHNLNANAIGALQDEFNSIKQDVGHLIKEMNAAIMQSDDFIKSIKG